MIIAVTGAKAAGKSTSLMKTAEFLKSNNISVSGIISKRIWKDGKRYGYELITLPDNSCQLLAAEDESFKDKDVFSFCSFYFLNKAMSDGINAIKNGCDADVLFIDEIGKIEINGGGWFESFEVVKKRKLPTILGVREDALPRLGELGIEPDISITVTEEQSDVSEILADIIMSERGK